MKINKKGLLQPIAKQVILYKLVALSAAVVLILEISGSRILAPYLGSSTQVWTAIITVILASLSVGYWMGGRFADKGNPIKIAKWVFLAATISIVLLRLSKNDIITLALHVSSDPTLQALIASCALFAIPSILLAMIQPLITKYVLDSQHQGAIIGAMSASSTIGSIVGSLLTGFVLLPNLSLSNILILCSILSGICTITLVFFDTIQPLHNKIGASIGIVLFLTVVSVYTNSTSSHPSLVYEGDSHYAHIRIIDTPNKVRILRTNNEYSSAQYLYRDDLVFPYTQFYDIFEWYIPNASKTLMIGGGAFTYPTYFVKKYTDKEIDVVEIDSKLIELSRTYFRLQDNPRLRIFIQDGRQFLSQNSSQYDVIFGDAFSAENIPSHLVTKEAFLQVKNNLNPDGVFIINIIGSQKVTKQKAFNAILATIDTVFPHRHTFAMNTTQSDQLQNYIVVASSKQLALPPLDSLFHKKYFTQYLNYNPRRDVILTDEFSPIDYWK